MTKPPRRASRLILGLVALAALLPYLRLPALPLVYDAPAAVSRNEAVQHGSPWRVFGVDFWGAPLDADYSTRSYRPLVSLSWALETRAGFGSAATLHLGDMALHIVVALLVVALGEALGLSRVWAAAGGALFALHPLATEAVASVVGRADLLAALLLFSALLLHFPSTEGRSTARELAACACIAAALLCKEYAVVFPFILVGIDLARAKDLRAAIARAWPFWLALATVLAGYLALRLALIGALGGVPMLAAPDHPLVDAPLATRCVTAARLLLLAARLLVLPLGLNHHYRAGTLPVDDRLEGAALAGAALALGSLAAAWWWSRRRREAVPLAAWLLVFGPLLPSLNVLTLAGVLFAERYLYVGLAGFALLVAWIAERLAVRPAARRVALALVGVVLLFGLLAGTRRVGDWSSDERLARSSLAAYPEGSEVWRDLGLAVGREGRHAEALAAFERSLELEPRAPQTWKAYATALVNLGRYEEGARAWRECIERTPDEVPAALYRGEAEALLYAARARVMNGDVEGAQQLVDVIHGLAHADADILAAAREVAVAAARLRVPHEDERPRR